MARDWMRDRNDFDRDERRRLRGDWDRDSRGFGGDNDRFSREATMSERDEGRQWGNRFGADRGHGSSGGGYDRDRMYGSEPGHDRGGYDRGRSGQFGDFDRDRDRDRFGSMDLDGGRFVSGPPYGRGGDRHFGGGMGSDRYLGGMGSDRGYGGMGSDRDRGYGELGSSRGYGSGSGMDRSGMGGYDRGYDRGNERFDFGDRHRHRSAMGGGMGRDRMGGDYRDRGEDRGFFQRMGDWFGDVTGMNEDRPRGRGPRNYTRSDERIRDDVYDRLMDNPWVDSSEVEVKVNNAEVTLTGTVPSRHDKRTIEDIAESVLGVKEVHNQLRRQDRMQQTSGTNAGASGSTGRTGTTTGTDNGPRRDLRT